jgi:hypothetical protein
MMDFVEFGFHQAQAIARELVWRQIGLEVEEAEFVGEPGVVDVFQDLKRLVRRLVRAVDDEHLLLGAHAADAGFDQPTFEHQLERLDLSKQGFHELLID